MLCLAHKILDTLAHNPNVDKENTAIDWKLRFI